MALCGAGLAHRQGSELLQACPDITALDVAPKSLGQAQGEAAVAVLHAGLQLVGLPSSRQDVGDEVGVSEHGATHVSPQASGGVHSTECRSAQAAGALPEAALSPMARWLGGFCGPAEALEASENVRCRVAAADAKGEVPGDGGACAGVGTFKAPAAKGLPPRAAPAASCTGTHRSQACSLGAVPRPWVQGWKGTSSRHAGQAWHMHLVQQTTSLEQAVCCQSSVCQLRQHDLLPGHSLHAVHELASLTTSRSHDTAAAMVAAGERHLCRPRRQDWQAGTIEPAEQGEL